MKQINNIEIDFSKTSKTAAFDLKELALNLKDALKDRELSEDEIFAISKEQVAAEFAANTVNILQQSEMFHDKNLAMDIASLSPDSSEEGISGKARKLLVSPETAKEELAKIYEDRSNTDSPRIVKMRLEFLNNNNKKINFTEIKELSKEVAIYNNLQKDDQVDLSQVTMDMVVDYLQEQHKVEISTQQRNFLRTQWNQGSIQGSRALLTPDLESKARATKDKDSAGHCFVFKNNKLQNTQYSETFHEVDEDAQILETDKAVSKVTADISHLAGETSPNKPTLSTEDWLPQNKANVTVSYKSSGNLPTSISQDFIDAIGPDAVKIGYETSITKELNKIKDNFSHFIRSFSPTTNRTEQNSNNNPSRGR